MNDKSFPSVEREGLLRSISAQILQLNDGDRLPSIRELAASLDVSIGSVSNAIKQLEASGAIVIQRKGRLGSFLESKSIGKLWEITEGCPFIISYTLPSNARYQGLATGLKSLLMASGIETYLTFVRGSRPRITLLQGERCHMSIMSVYAAEELISPSEVIILKLPTKSFTTEHRVFFYDNNVLDPDYPIKVAIDRESIDQAHLTELEFEGSKAEFVPVSFMQIDRFLSDGLVDAAVWTVDDMQLRAKGNVLERKLSDKVPEGIYNKIRAAALVIRKNDAVVRAVVEETIKVYELLNIQQMVLDGHSVPEY